MRKSTVVIITLVLTLVSVAAIGALGIAVWGWGKDQVSGLIPGRNQVPAPPAPSEKVPNAPAPDNSVKRLEGPLGEPESPAADPKPTGNDEVDDARDIDDAEDSSEGEPE